jgi:hypothetical protein
MKRLMISIVVIAYLVALGSWLSGHLLDREASVVMGVSGALLASTSLLVHFRTRNS